MAVSLTERAAKEVKKILEENKYEPATLLRVGVAGGGCSGFQYSLGFDQKYDEKIDSKYDCHGVSVVVDKKSRFVSRRHDGRFLRRPRKTRLHVREPQRHEKLRLR